MPGFILIIFAALPPSEGADSPVHFLPDAAERAQLLHARLPPLFRRSSIGDRPRRGPHAAAAAAVAPAGALVSAGIANDNPAGFLACWLATRASLTANICLQLGFGFAELPLTVHDGTRNMV